MAISVLLPFHDAGPTIDVAIASTLEDLGPGDELVAIDDRSRDDGPSRVAAWARRDARVVVVPGAAADAGGGIVAALAHGLAAARHALVGRMDADDVTLPGRFAAQVAALEAAPSLAAVGTQVEAFTDDAQSPLGEGILAYVAWQNALVTPHDHAHAIFVESPLCHPSVLLRRAALEAVGGFRDVAWPEDWDLWLRLDAAGFGLAKVPQVLLRWRRHARATTVRDPRCAPERLLDARATFLAPRLLARGAPFAVWGAGRTGRRLARALAAHGARPAFFVDIDPRKIGHAAFGAEIRDAARVLEDARDELPPLLVVAVGERGARDVVRARLHAAGLREGEHFVCAA